jgi:hypothetical protein
MTWDRHHVWAFLVAIFSHLNVAVSMISSQYNIYMYHIHLQLHTSCMRYQGAGDRHRIPYENHESCVCTLAFLMICIGKVVGSCLFTYMRLRVLKMYVCCAGWDLARCYSQPEPHHIVGWNNPWGQPVVRIFMSLLNIQDVYIDALAQSTRQNSHDTFLRSTLEHAAITVEVHGIKSAE